MNESQKHYGLEMEGQSKSHIELIKIIVSIVAFESVKLNREKKQSNLSKYRIPIDVERLYEYFISHSYEGRRAMLHVLRYHEIRKNKK